MAYDDNIRLAPYWYLRFDGTQYWVMYISGSTVEEHGSSSSLQTALNMYCEARAIRYYKGTGNNTPAAIVNARNQYAADLANVDASRITTRMVKVQWGEGI